MQGTALSDYFYRILDEYFLQNISIKLYFHNKKTIILYN